MADPVLGYDDEELVVIGVDERNWKGIGISLVVIASIFSVIGLAIFLLTPNAHDDNFGIHKVDIDEIVGTKFKAKLFNGYWISATEMVFLDWTGGISIYDAHNNETVKTLVHSSIVREHNVQSFKLSFDRQLLLLVTNTRTDFDLTSVSDFIIYNITHQYATPLKEKLMPYFPNEAPVIQYACWAPVGNRLILVSRNDIYYLPSFESKVERLTNTGVLKTIYNGIEDWLYANYVSGDQIGASVWWSPDGSAFVYATFNDSAIQTHPIKLYGSLEDAVSKTFTPKIVTQRYPKAGLEEQNPTVALWYISLNGSESELKQITAPEEVADKEHYITFVRWMNVNELMVLWTLRTQNLSVITSCGQQNKWVCKQIMSLPNTISTLRDLRTSILSKQNENLYFVRAPRPDTELGSYFHISLNKFNEQSKFTNFVTHGKYDVTKLLAFDSELNELYYQRTAGNCSQQRHIYKLQVNQSKSSECITCHLNDGCNYYEAMFSFTAKYYVLQCLGPIVPFSQLWQTANKSKITNLIDNNNLKADVKLKRLPSVRMMTVSIDNIKPPIIVKVLMPPPKLPKDLKNDEEEEIHYPLIVESTTPNKDSVSDLYTIDWGSYLASRKEFIYAKVHIDQRNERNGHSKFTYRKYPFDIQIEVIKYLVKTISEIDANKIAIWGSGIGAFNALSSLVVDGHNTLQCAIAVAPVTNWRYLDTVTAEHTFGLPLSQENFATYETINLINKAQALANRKFLVIHGTADAEFHVQNTLMLSKALIQTHKTGAINYQFQIYADDDHFMSKSKQHFYRLIENFLEKCFATVRKNSSTESPS